MSTATRATKSPRQLYSIAKRLGVWDPEELLLAEDRPHWEALNAEQQHQLPYRNPTGACFFPARSLKR